MGPTQDVDGGERPGVHSLARLACVAALPQADLAELMRGARLVIANGGSTLLQAIACGAPCVAAPIAGDQRERIRACAAAGVAVEAAPRAADLERASAADFSRTRPRVMRSRVARRRSNLADGVDVALDALARLPAAELSRMPNIVLFGYDLDQPSFRHRMRSLVRPLECAGWTVRTERFPSGRYGLRTWERRALLRWADVVVLHQIKLSAIEARLFAAFSQRRVFDVDDAIYVRKPRRLGEPADESLWRRRKFAATCRCGRCGGGGQ